MKNILFFFCMFFGSATLSAQTKNDSIPVNKRLVDSTELLIDLLSKDSLLYRPEGDPFIIALIKQNDLRSMEFLLLHCHERPYVREGMFDMEDMQDYYARRFYIEEMIFNYANKWVFVSAFSKLISENEFSDERLRGLSSLVYYFFDSAVYTSIFSDLQKTATPLAKKNISKFKSKLNF